MFHSMSRPQKNWYFCSSLATTTSSCTNPWMLDEGLKFLTSFTSIEILIFHFYPCCYKCKVHHLIREIYGLLHAKPSYFWADTPKLKYRACYNINESISKGKRYKHSTIFNPTFWHYYNVTLFIDIYCPDNSHKWQVLLWFESGCFTNKSVIR